MRQPIESDPVQILVVDDHPENLLALEAILASPRRHVVTAGSGEEALRKLLDHEFAVIMLDVMMPGMDGFETASLIRGREATRHIPIVFLTANGSDLSLIYRGYSVGAVDYLVKPLQAEIVRAKVEVFVELHRRQLRIRSQELQLREAERQRSAEALRASESQYEATFNQAAVGIAHLGPDGRWQRANKHLCEMLGQTEEQLCEQTFLDVTHAETGAADWAVLQAVLAGHGDKIHRQTRLQTRQGVKLWVELSVSLLRDARGDVRHFVVVIEDVTGRRHGEELRSFLSEATSVLLSSLDHQNTLGRLAELTLGQVADLCVIELLGVQPQADGDHLAGQRAELILAHRDPALAEALRVAWRSDSHAPAAPSTEGPALAMDVSTSILASHVGTAAAEVLGPRLALRSMMVVPLLGHDGVLGRLTLGLSAPGHRYGAGDLAMAEDLAYRVAMAIDNARLYAKAQAAIRARDEFMSIASHELRTPLTPLLLQLENLASASTTGRLAQTPGKLDAALKRMERQVHRLASLIDKLLDVTRVTAGLQLQEEPVDLGALAEEVSRRFVEEAAANGSTLELDLPRSPQPIVEGSWDRLRLEQVVSNLLSNAVKYGRGQPIVISLRPVAGRAQLVVRDRGIGIPPQALSRIFERFERAVPARSYGGLGLGLYITRQIVEAHGGAITVESEPGAGATFTVDLPLAIPGALPLQTVMDESGPALSARPSEMTAVSPATVAPATAEDDSAGARKAHDREAS